MGKIKKTAAWCLILLVLLSAGIVTWICLDRAETQPTEWTAEIDGRDGNLVPLGTMQKMAEECKQLPDDPNRMTTYGKEEMIDFITVDLDTSPSPGYSATVSVVSVDLVAIHEQFPVEWVSIEEENPQTGRDRIRVVYKVQDQEGRIEYLSLVFEDVYSNGYVSGESDAPVIEVATDASGNIVKERVDDEWECWSAFGTSYSIQDTLA